MNEIAMLKQVGVCRAVHESVPETKTRMTELKVDGRTVRCFPSRQVQNAIAKEQNLDGCPQPGTRDVGWCATCVPGATSGQAGSCDPANEKIDVSHQIY